MMPFLRAIAAFVLIVPLLTAEELNTLKGQKITGNLVSADDSTIVIKTATGDVATPIADALQLTVNPTPAKLPDKYIDVELIDGSLFHCTGFSFKAKTLVLDVLPGMKRTIPMEKVAYILADAQDPNIRKEWDTLFAERGRTDRFFIRQDNRLDGLPGTFGDASEDGKSIAFETEG